LNRELFLIASHVALRIHQSTWAVLYQAVKARFTGTTQDAFRSMLTTISQLVKPEVLADTSLSRSPHPWFDDQKHVAWALVRRLGMYLGSPEYYAVVPREDVPDVIAPLYAQPVVETLLKIPLYRLFEGGRDRGLARRAFVAEVPDPILGRLWKDRAPGFHDVLMHQRREFLREMLLDGVLVREGLLERSLIEQALAERVSKIQVLPVEIMRHLDVELWARAWGP
jgi:asparagine synthase (glutamine-hydrolysing)